MLLSVSTAMFMFMNYVYMFSMLQLLQGDDLYNKL